MSVGQKAEWETAKRRHDLSGFAYEFASPDYQDEYWNGLAGGGDQEGFKLLYEIMLREYRLPNDRQDAAEHFGLDDHQNALLLDLARKIAAMQKAVGIKPDNTVYVTNEAWPDLVAAAQALFIALNHSRRSP
jgi:hypothetical protein